jgi:hypothetical protein
VKCEWILFEDFNKDAQLTERQEQFNGDVRGRCVVLNRVIIVGVSDTPRVALKMGTAGDERGPNFVDSDKRGADTGGVTRQLLDDYRVRVAVRDAWACIHRARCGDCGAGGQREKPQKQDACVDEGARSRNPQPEATIS